MDYNLRITEIGATVSAYPLHIVCNMVESGIFIAWAQFFVLVSKIEHQYVKLNSKKHKARVTQYFASTLTVHMLLVNVTLEKY